ncbi:MAG: S-layer homology domain-containing protein [Clostridiales bacterium]|nr:S-layer homology domain-containing protein [Clostridiales bacterium]
MKRYISRFAAAVLAFLCLAGITVNAADRIPVNLNEPYALDFSLDSWGYSPTYELSFDINKTTDYEMFTSGSQRTMIALYKMNGGGYSLVASSGYNDDEDSDKDNAYINHTLEEGASYFCRVLRKDSRAPVGSNDATFTVREYVDDSTILADFNSTADFPDENFKNYLLNTKKVDFYPDGKLTKYEADKITYLEPTSKGITSLKGIEFFSNLEWISCYSNKLTAIDLSNCPKLRRLSCDHNNITSLDLSRCPKLQRLFCYNNELSSLDLTHNALLYELDCNYNHISTIDLSKCPLLLRVEVTDNDLTSINVKGLGLLEYLELQNRQNTSNHGNNKLTSLDLSGCVNLNYLDVSGNALTSLDLSQNKTMGELHCENNKISALNVRNCSVLDNLSCSNNELTKLDISDNNDLGILNCSGNKLTELDLSSHPLLEYLACNNNNINALDISGNPKLVKLYENGPKNASADPLEYGSYNDVYMCLDKKVQVTANKPAPGNLIAIDENNFPDEVFREYVKQFDKDNDGYFSQEELWDVKMIKLSEMTLDNLEGIRFFSKLEEFSAAWQVKFKSADFSGLTKLKDVYINQARVENMNVDGCTSLKYLEIYGNRLETLNVTDCHELLELNVYGSSLEMLDISECPKLRYLDVGNTDIDFIDISECPTLVKIYLEGSRKTEAGRYTYSFSLSQFELTIDKDCQVKYMKPTPTPTVTPAATVTPAVTATPAADPNVSPTAAPKATTKPGTTDTPKATTNPNATLTLNKKTANIVCGKDLTLKATLKGASDTVTWSSSNDKVASVDKDGKVTAKQAGAVTITATAAGKTATCNVQILFKDVTNEKDFWYAPTYYLANTGVVKGYDKQTKFKPANVCTRAQMVTFIWRLKGEPAPKTSKNKFKDVKKTDYFYKACLWGNENHIVEGYKDGTFGPKIVCARRHAVTFLWRLAGKPNPKTTKNKFKDVKKTDYFYKATLWASEKKILAGYSDGTFRPNGNCLRRQMVTFLYKYDKFVNKKG